MNQGRLCLDEVKKCGTYVARAQVGLLLIMFVTSPVKMCPAYVDDRKRENSSCRMTVLVLDPHVEVSYSLNFQLWMLRLRSLVNCM